MTPLTLEPTTGTPDPRRCYTLAQVLAMTQIPRRTFDKHWKAGKLPWAKEILPRVGEIIRLRKDLVDLYVSGQWDQPRSFFGSRRRRGRAA